MGPKTTSSALSNGIRNSPPPSPQSADFAGGDEAEVVVEASFVGVGGEFVVAAGAAGAGLSAGSSNGSGPAAGELPDAAKPEAGAVEGVYDRGGFEAPVEEEAGVEEGAHSIVVPPDASLVATAGAFAGLSGAFENKARSPTAMTTSAATPPATPITTQATGGRPCGAAGFKGAAVNGPACGYVLFAWATV
jgi:hypothetical protein